MQRRKPMTNLQSALDAVLDGVVSAGPRVPGVVAMVTDRKANVYEGAAGERLLGSARP
jgi:methyl acetate hydrolase